MRESFKIKFEKIAEKCEEEEIGRGRYGVTGKGSEFFSDDGTLITTEKFCQSDHL